MTNPVDITRDAMAVIQQTAKAIETALVGRYVRVTSNHNGQPHGRSRKSWRGQVCKIVRVHVEVYGEIQLQLEGHEYECFIRAEEVEFA